MKIFLIMFTAVMVSCGPQTDNSLDLSDPAVQLQQKLVSLRGLEKSLKSSGVVLSKVKAPLDEKSATSNNDNELGAPDAEPTTEATTYILTIDSKQDSKTLELALAQLETLKLEIEEVLTAHGYDRLPTATGALLRYSDFVMLLGKLEEIKTGIARLKDKN